MAGGYTTPLPGGNAKPSLPPGFVRKRTFHSYPPTVSGATVAPPQPPEVPGITVPADEYASYHAHFFQLPRHSPGKFIEVERPRSVGRLIIQVERSGESMGALDDFVHGNAGAATGCVRILRRGDGINIARARRSRPDIFGEGDHPLNCAVSIAHHSRYINASVAGLIQMRLDDGGFCVPCENTADAISRDFQCGKVAPLNDAVGAIVTVGRMRDAIHRDLQLNRLQDQG